MIPGRLSPAFFGVAEALSVRESRRSARNLLCSAVYSPPASLASPPLAWHRYAPPSASSMRAKLGAGTEAVGATSQGTWAIHPFPPIYLQKKRSDRQPSTPKGVGRDAPLTAAGRSAKSAGRSAEQGTTGTGLEGGRGCGRNRGSAVHNNLALRCGCRRPQAADHDNSPFTCVQCDFSWSAAWGLWFTGGPSCCGRGVAARAAGGVDGEGSEAGQERIGHELRLGIGWRS